MGNTMCSGYTHEGNQLQRYVKSGDAARVEQVLNLHPELITCQRGLSEGLTVWHQAARAGAVGVLTFLAEFAAAADLAAEPAAGPVGGPAQQQLMQQLELRNGKGHTALMVACAVGHAECAALLVKMGVDLFCADRQSRMTAVHLAAREGHPDCIRAVLSNMLQEQAVHNRVRVQDASNITGLTPLHFAVSCDHVACVEALLEFDVCLTPKSSHFTAKLDGCTPLHFAATRGNIEAARSILRHYAAGVAHRDSFGSSSDIRLLRDSLGLTPFQVARHCGNLDLIELLHPQTDLISTFGIQDVAATASGIAKLSVLAAAALQLKLLADIKLVTQVSNKKALPAEPRASSRPSRPSPSQRNSVSAVLPAAAAAAVQVAAAGAPSPPTTPGRLVSPRGRGAAAVDLAAAAVATSGRVSATGWLPSHPHHASSNNLKQLSSPAAAGETAAAAAGRISPALSSVLLRSPVRNRVWPKDKAEDDPAAAAAVQVASMSLPLGVSSSFGVEVGCAAVDVLCGVCLDRTPNVAINGCEHGVCATCAQQMCSRVTDKPLTCPFCRKCIGSFHAINQGLRGGS